MKFENLTGAALDHLVAKAEGYTHLGAVGTFEPTAESERPFCRSRCNDWWKTIDKKHTICGPCTGFPFDYSSDWASGGPIIEREGIWVEKCGQLWRSRADDMGAPVWGRTALEAAMRAYVASKFPDGVPEETAA